MRSIHLLFVGALLLSGCPDKNKETPPLPSATVTAPPPPTTSAVLVPEQPTGPAEVVRPELDNRDDGLTGKALIVAGTKAAMQIASDWQVTKGDAQTASAADQKSRLAASAYGAEGHTPAIDKLSVANGLTACTWAPVLSLTVGKDKLAAQAADGACTRNGAKVSAAYVATEGLVVLGSWDEGADRSALFGAMRTIAKAKGGGTPTSKLSACCQALASAAKANPQPQQGFMMQAAATCQAAARANNLSAVNAALSQFGMKCN